ncbi:hypothetical protein DPMN_017828 [Dreissena polymorpha]|uniref:Uncharacterized protein n=1 Tax=Dreissena polymorpha TaxID=45954 RepID=A0A9D4NFK9_DREPO|nr:hypothetical protein DPMN_017828 [Dreissena polymorpha]
MATRYLPVGYKVKDLEGAYNKWRWEWLHEKDYAVVYGRGVNWLRKVEACGKAV